MSSRNPSISRFRSQFARLKALWILRAFSTSKRKDCFFNVSGFADDDLAEFLGLMETGNGGRDRAVTTTAMNRMHHELEATTKVSKVPHLAQRNLMRFTQALGLDQISSEILSLLITIAGSPELRDMWRLLRKIRVGSGMVDLVSAILGVSRINVKSALDSRSRLIQTGLIESEDGFKEWELAEAFFERKLSDTDLIEFYGVNKAPDAELTCESYTHIGAALELLLNYLRVIKKSKVRGVNILLYGTPGTGKTQMARAIGDELSMVVFEQSPTNENGGIRSPMDRLKGLQMAGTVLASSGGLLVFDEAEDVFCGSFLSRSVAAEHKAWINRLLEENAMPTIWISNSVRSMDSAALRRFDMILEVQVPPHAKRVEMLEREAGQFMEKKTIECLAENDRLSPAILKRAVKVVDALGENASAFDRKSAFLNLTSATLKAQGFRGVDEPRVDYIPHDVYDVSLVNADCDLASIASNLSHNPSARICLYGPPGTGKTAFGHWLAKRLGKPLLVKKASDLLSPYVGEAERLIDEAFLQADRDGSLLLIDEVDSFLRPRGEAVRSWEVTQVNQMLTSMESFPGVFLATTNLVEGLDSAALRRFDIKLHVDFLSGEQVSKLVQVYSSHLQLGEPVEEVLDSAALLSGVTPGDFAVVARRHRFHPLQGPQGLVDAVIGELKHKQIQAPKIGFFASDV